MQYNNQETNYIKTTNKQAAHWKSGRGLMPVHLFKCKMKLLYMLNVGGGEKDIAELRKLKRLQKSTDKIFKSSLNISDLHQYILGSSGFRPTVQSESRIQSGDPNMK